jgi:hypothetical protein
VRRQLTARFSRIQLQWPVNLQPIAVAQQLGMSGAPPPDAYFSIGKVGSWKLLPQAGLLQRLPCGGAFADSLFAQNLFSGFRIDDFDA